MKYLILIFVFLLSCKSPKLKEEKVAKQELAPPFNNQGEQEDYWAQELFKKEYKKKIYPKFIGEIKVNNNIVYFGEDQFVGISNIYPSLQLIFKEGLFYPEILEVKNFSITNIEEIAFLSNTPKIKRFRFLLGLGNKKRSNPQVCVFELTNSKANKETNLKSFIKNAKLTFVKKGWIII